MQYKGKPPTNADLVLAQAIRARDKLRHPELYPDLKIPHRRPKGSVVKPPLVDWLITESDLRQHTASIPDTRSKTLISRHVKDASGMNGLPTRSAWGIDGSVKVSLVGTDLFVVARRAL